MTLSFLDTYLYTDQPFICPKCGARTDVLLDMTHTTNVVQVEMCLGCGYQFVIQTDEIL